MDDRDKKLKIEGAKAALIWLAIRKKYGYKNEDTLSLYIDFDHSALLKRLLDGKQALPEPPPVAFSYPNYDLIDNGFCYPYDVFEAQESFAKAYGCETMLGIDQSLWKIVEKRGPEEWIVQYHIIDHADDFDNLPKIIWCETLFKIFKEDQRWKIERL